MLYTYDNPEKENERRMLLHDYERTLIHTDNELEEKSERRMLQPDNGYERRNLQNFDTLNKDP